jgi:adenylate cyclase
VTSPAARKVRAALLPGLAAGVLAAAAALPRDGAVERLEKLLYDVRAAHAARAQPASRGVALVALDDETIRLAGGTYPIPRGALAAIVDEARRAGARVVALDLLLQDPLEGSLADENEALARAFAHGDVVLAAAVPPAPAGARPAFRLAPPLPRFAAAAAALGGVTQDQEEDGRVHALRHVYATDAGEVWSLPLAAVWLARGRPAVRQDGARLLVGDVAAPLGEDGRVLVRWLGPWDGRGEAAESVYPIVSGATLLRAALARDGDGAPPDAAALAPLSGAIAVVSSTASAAKDKRPTPVNPRAVGGEIVATAVDGLLRGVFVARAPPAADAAAALALAALAALAVGLLGASVARPAAGAALSAASVAALLGGWWLLSSALVARGAWLAAAAPMGGGFLAALGAEIRLVAAERRDRRFVHDALGRYTSPALVRALLERRELLDRFGGARQELSVFFSDVRGFTRLAEQLEPERLVELLNAYLSSQAEIVERHGGYVDKYVGDAIMAVWGAPVPARDHAARACRAALEMRARLAELRPGWKERFGVELFARAGLNTCLAVAGNVGSRTKANYTVLGDGVNLASRLEGANKAFGTELLVGDATRAAAGDAFVFRSVDLLRVVGKRAGVAVHELLGLSAALGPAEVARAAAWEGAVADFRARRFDRARGAFAALLRDRPGDALAALYVARCETFVAAPPPPDWDGVHDLAEK